jgi:hypothetical protein
MISRILIAVAIMGSSGSCGSSGMDNSACAYVTVFGLQTNDVKSAFSDPIGDAEKLFARNGKYNIIFSQENGVWDLYYQGGDAVLHDVSGYEEYKDKKFENSFRKVSLAVGSIVKVNRISIVRNLHIDPTDLGTRSKMPSPCFDDKLIKDYVRKFNRKSLDLVAESLG